MSVIEASRRGRKQGILGELNLEALSESCRLLLLGGSLNTSKEAVNKILILVDEAHCTLRPWGKLPLLLLPRDSLGSCPRCPLLQFQMFTSLRSITHHASLLTAMATNQALVFGVALSILSVLTIKDLFPSKAATEVQGQNTYSSLNDQKKYAGPAIKFLFW